MKLCPQLSNYKPLLYAVVKNWKYHLKSPAAWLFLWKRKRYEPKSRSPDDKKKNPGVISNSIFYFIQVKYNFICVHYLEKAAFSFLSVTRFDQCRIIWTRNLPGITKAEHLKLLLVNPPKQPDF